MKKIIASIIIVALLVSIFSTVYASAETNSAASLAESHEANEILKENYWYLPVSETTANIVEYIGNEDKVNIPSEIDGYKIVGIDDGAFICCGTITEVVIPDGVTSIGKYAFYACNKLSKISFPNTLVSIGRAAFLADSLKNVVIPDSVQEIERGAFAGNKNLADVKIGTGIQTIGKNAFNYTNIITISGYVNTVAYEYAYENRIKFISLGNAPETVTTVPTQPTTDKPAETVSTEPQTTETQETIPATDKPAETVVTEPYTTETQAKFPTVKQANPIKVTVKTKTVKAKKLKKKAQKVKAIIVKNNQGKVTYKLVKSGITKKIRKLVKINSKGVITIKKWKKAKKGNYKIKLKITAKGNSKYNTKSILKTIRIKIS